METQKTSILSNGLLWFGAAISIAEILTGTLLAPLGFIRGTAAVLIGHIIGCALLYLAGLIGAKSGKTAMESVRISFGSKGSYLFSIINVLQLVGWTAVMIIGGAKAMGVIANSGLHLSNDLLWCALIGVLIIGWIAVGIKNLGKVNLIAVGGLFALTIVLSTVVFKGGSGAVNGGGMRFGAAVELSAAMPISWLPLISDYTKQAKKPRAATLVSTLAYFAASSWMYIIGLGAAVFTGNSDIAQVMTVAGLGLMGVLIVLLSTVTTTFLDAYSAGVSFTNMVSKANEKWVAILICIAGTLIAMVIPIEQYVNFLYLIGSVFAPMIAILITDFFILKKDHSGQAFNSTNLILWLAGFVIYRLFLSVDTILGSTLPVMVIVGSLSIAIEGGKKICLKKS
jgi:putative hydroxymethylpyrimidine transporter CytX